jgi:predicted amidohydrolase YtcJ
MNFLQNQNDPQLPELKERLRNQFPFFGDDMLRTGAIGEWAAPLASGAAWRTAQHLVGQAGWRNENAVQNLAGLRQVVEEYESVNRENDITKLRWVVHHVPEVNKDLLDRLKALGCGVEMGAFRWVTSADPKVVTGPPFRTIFDHGITVGMHGDGVHIAPLNPWLHIYYAVTGKNSFGDPVNPGQQLTRAEALQLFTRNNAWFLRMEDKIGTIETGKLADVAVLDRDYFTVPEADLKKVRSALTIVNGKIVHDSRIA